MVTLEAMIEEYHKKSDCLPVFCESREDFDKLMNELEDLGWHWRGGDKPTKFSPGCILTESRYVYCKLDIPTERITYTEDYFGDDFISASKIYGSHNDKDQYVGDDLLNFLIGIMGGKM